MMPLKPNAFGHWAPDQPATSGERLTVAQGVIPYRHYYAPLKGLVATSDALASRPLGACAVRDPAGAVHIYAGTATKLYELNTNGSWTDRSKGGGYTATTSTRWRFWTRDDRLFATNGQDPIQFIDMTAGSAFADLAGSPPLAQFGAAFSQFNFLGNTDSSAQRIVWSAINDDEAYVDGIDQSGGETFEDGGLITGFAALDALYVFQETCIRRAVYTGPPNIFAFDKIEKERGCIAPGSLIQLGRLIFFRAEDGFYAFDGEQSTPIGVDGENASLYDQWFTDNAQRDFFYRMSGAIDPRTKTARWAFASTSSATGQPDTMLIYNWAAGRAAYASIDLEVLAPILSQSLTLEDLDAIYGDLDSIPISLDDPILAGGVMQLGAFDADYMLARFSGDNAEAILTTDDFFAGDFSVTEVQALAPMVDTDDAVMSVGYRFKYQDAVTFSSETSMNAIGICPARVQGRYVRTKLRIPAAATWTKAEGFGMSSIRRGGR